MNTLTRHLRQQSPHIASYTAHCRSRSVIAYDGIGGPEKASRSQHVNFRHAARQVMKSDFIAAKRELARLKTARDHLLSGGTLQPSLCASFMARAQRLNGGVRPENTEQALAALILSSRRHVDSMVLCAKGLLQDALQKEPQ